MISTQSAPPEAHPGKRAGRLPAILYAALFVLLGVTALLWFLLAVASDPGIRAALAWTPVQGEQPPSTIMAFLTQFGITMPLLVIGLSIASIWLGFRLRKQDVVAARWAQTALVWLAAGALVVALSGAIGVVAGVIRQPQAPLDVAQLVQPLAVLLIGLVFALALWWLRK